MSMKLALAIVATIAASATVAQAHEKIETTALSAAMVVQTNTSTGQLRICYLETPKGNPMNYLAGTFVCGEWNDE